MSISKMEVFGEQTKDMESKGKKTPAFGIDLGTTNSCIAVVQAGTTPKIIIGEFPSCVMWKGKKGEFVVGKVAYNNRYKPSCIYSVKRLIGKDEVVNLKYGPRKIQMTPVEVSAEILKALVKEASEEYKDIKDVVITVPAYFNNKEVSETMEAGKLAGLNVLNILREPTAATLVYETDIKDKKEQRLLVYDLGGGTFDVSLVRVTKNESEGLEDIYGKLDDATSDRIYSVIDTDGDSRLGGDDIDKELYSIIESKMMQEGVDINKIPQVEKEKLILRLERMKKSGPGVYFLNVNMKLTDGKKVEKKVEVTYGDFVNATKVIYKKTKNKIDTVLGRAKNKDLDAIVLVGGSTKSVIIKELLRKDFVGIPINDALDPDEAVALGASLQAKELKFGSKNIEVFDILPLGIGVLSKNHVRSLIKRGQRVPTSNYGDFTTVEDNQKQIKVDIYQGNSSLVEESLYLGSIVANVPLKKAGEAKVRVVTSVDSNGLLKCRVVTENDDKYVELVNLFGGSEKKKDLTSIERRVIKWKSFASSIENEHDRKDLLNIIEKYSRGECDIKDVTDLISKYRKVRTELEKPSHSLQEGVN